MSFSNPNPEILGPNLGVIADRLGDAVTYQSSLDTQTSWDSLDLPALGEEYEDFEGEEDDEEETLLNDVRFPYPFFFWCRFDQLSVSDFDSDRFITRSSLTKDQPFPIFLNRY